MKKIIVMFTALCVLALTGFATTVSAGEVANIVQQQCCKCCPDKCTCEDCDCCKGKCDCCKDGTCGTCDCCKGKCDCDTCNKCTTKCKSKKCKKSK